jgi:AcrR family transcriptional regulator
MKNKDVQEKRMKGYFIQATKEILKSEGIKHVSVRSVADRAGYSYTTMYNYFKDLNDLVFYCVEDFFDECKDFAGEKVASTPNGVEKLKSKIVAYADYFIEYPGIFELFFLERMGDLQQKQSAIDLISLSLDRVCEEEWIYCLDHDLVKFKDAELIKNQIRYIVAGLLLFYLNRITPTTYSVFKQRLTAQLDAVFNG